MKQNVENGRIFFEGDASAIVKANLWLRTADRIKIVVDVLTQQRLTNYSNKPKRSLGNL